MSNLGQYNIDWNNVKENDFGGFKPLAEGAYGAKITKSEIKKTKANDDMLSLEFTLLGGKGIKNRKVFETVMLTHSNPVVVNIGLNKLKTLADILDIPEDDFQDSSQLHGLPLTVNLTIETSETYGDQNRIKFFSEFDESLLSETPSDSTLF